MSRLRTPLPLLVWSSFLLLLLMLLSPLTTQTEQQLRDTNKLPVHEVVEPKSWVRACYLSREVPMDKIDPFLCTHLLAFFGDISTGELTIADEYESNLNQSVAIRDRHNPKLRVSVTCGGTSDQYAAIAASNTSRAVFAASAVRIINKYNLDGIDLDWEFPAFLRPGHERHDFTLLLESLSEALHALQPPRLVSSAVGAPSVIVAVSYDIPRIAAAVDFVSVMTYDFHFYQTLQEATGHNAPLFAAEPDMGFFAELNTNFSVHDWLDGGMPAAKLLLGIPVYGHGWTLRDPNNHGLRAPASGPWKSGYVSYADVCHLLTANGTSVWDSFTLTPYAYRGVEWLSYDDERSVTAKATLVRALGLAGAMTFDLDMDDWAGVCGRGIFPLHNVVRQMLPNKGD